VQNRGLDSLKCDVIVQNYVAANQNIPLRERVRCEASCDTHGVQSVCVLLLRFKPKWGQACLFRLFPYCGKQDVFNSESVSNSVFTPYELTQQS
jgi:hypothetical protein